LPGISSGLPFRRGVKDLFFKVKTSEEVFEILKGFSPVGEETISIRDAFNRILSKEIISEEDLPEFSRSPWTVML